MAAFRLRFVVDGGCIKPRCVGEPAANQLDLGDSGAGPIVSRAGNDFDQLLDGGGDVSATSNSPSSTLLAAALTPV